MRIAAGRRRARRGLNLTPMIDVVLLLLVFFMMVSRFGGTQGLPLAIGQGTGAWVGPPRLVEVGQDGLRLNGVAVAPEDLVAALRPLLDQGDTVVLRPRDGADVQRVVAVMDSLRAAGMTRLVLVE
jgi:biopolymer transport protein ExbD